MAKVYSYATDADYYDLYQLALDSIADCFGDSEYYGPFIRIKAESKAKRTMRQVLAEAEANDSTQDQIINEIMNLYHSPNKTGWRGNAHI